MTPPPSQHPEGCAAMGPFACGNRHVPVCTCTCAQLAGTKIGTHACTCQYSFPCTYMSTRTRLGMPMYICMHACLSVLLSAACVCAASHTPQCMYTHICLCIHVCLYSSPGPYVHIFTDVRIHMHIGTHAHANSRHMFSEYLC